MTISVLFFLSTGVAAQNSKSFSPKSSQTAAINVYALHVTTTDPITGAPVAETVLAAAQPQIDCQAGSSPTGGFGTGG